MIPRIWTVQNIEPKSQNFHNQDLSWDHDLTCGNHNLGGFQTGPKRFT